MNWQTNPAVPAGPMFLPYLAGERTPLNDPHACGLFTGLTGSTDRAAMTRAILEGVALSFADCLDCLRAAGTRVERLSAIGGGNPFGPVAADVGRCPATFTLTGPTAPKRARHSGPRALPAWQRREKAPTWSAENRRPGGFSSRTEASMRPGRKGWSFSGRRTGPRRACGGHRIITRAAGPCRTVLRHGNGRQPFRSRPGCTRPLPARPGRRR